MQPVKLFIANKFTKSRAAAAQPKQPAKQQNFKYKNAPVSKSTRYSMINPNVSSRGKSITVKHTEYIADISSNTSSFNVTGYSINPGLNATFPWLSSVASNYESYLFKKLHFHYKPICPTNTPGKAILAVDFDAADVAPTNKVVINSYESAVSCSVWDSCTNRSTTTNMRKFGVQRYVRGAATPANTDVKTYDIGKLYVATSNTPSTATTLGELFAEYEVELFTPQLPPTASVFERPRIPVGPVLFQLAKIAVSAAGVASLTAEYYGQPLFAILKQAVNGNNAVVDIGINPNIGKPLKVDMRGETGTTWGLGPYTNAVRSPIIYQVGSADYTVNITSDASNMYSRSFLITNGSASETTSGSSFNPQPYFRVQIPNSTVLTLNAYGLTGMPTAYGFLAPATIAGSIDPPFDPLNWAEIATSSSYVNDSNNLRDAASATERLISL